MLTREAGSTRSAEPEPGRGGADRARPSAARPEVETARFTPAEIARLFRSWEPLRNVLLAVSGGPDSVALMLLATAWARARSDAPRLQVATVDHGLRPSARDEAETVAIWADALGLTHEILVWDGPKPTSRIQERARGKRYELLCAHASAIGADAVATAHHADDQAETILFRLLRGSGVAGLAGMAATSERDGCRISRPLLECTKDELVACCEAAGHPYFEDPSNADPAFARTRIRDLLQRLEPEGLSKRSLLELGRRALRAEAALAEQARRASGRLEGERAADRFVGRAGSLADQPDEIVIRVVANEIRRINPGREIRLDRLERLVARFCLALRSGRPLRASLGGAAIELEPDGRLVVRRESERRRGRGIGSSLTRGQS